MDEPEKSWLESGKALLESEDYRKAVREMGRGEMTKDAKWFKDLLEKYKDDPEFELETHLLRIEEAVERIEKALAAAIEWIDYRTNFASDELAIKFLTEELKGVQAFIKSLKEG